MKAVGSSFLLPCWWGRALGEPQADHGGRYGFEAEMTEEFFHDD